MNHKQEIELLRRAASEEEDRLLDLYKQDAQRYRWLRDNFSNSYFLDHMTAVDALEPLGADEVDAAIDAAMKKEQPK